MKRKPDSRKPRKKRSKKRKVQDFSKGGGRHAFPVTLEPEGWTPNWKEKPQNAEEYLRRVHYEAKYLCDPICYDRSDSSSSIPSDSDSTPSDRASLLLIRKPLSQEKIPKSSDELSSQDTDRIEKFKKLQMVVQAEKKKRVSAQETQLLVSPPLGDSKINTNSQLETHNLDFYCTTSPSFNQIFDMDYISQQKLVMNLLDWVIEEKDEKRSKNLCTWIFWIFSSFETASHLPYRIASKMNQLVDFMSQKEKKEQLTEEERMIYIISVHIFHQKGTPTNLPKFLLK